jgi:hypothetical protein
MSSPPNSGIELSRLILRSAQWRGSGIRNPARQRVGGLGWRYEILTALMGCDDILACLKIRCVWKSLADCHADPASGRRPSTDNEWIGVGKPFCVAWSMTNTPALTVSP